MSVIYMQMEACMSDRKARSRDSFFFFFQSHITLNDAKLQPTSTHQHKTRRAADDTGHLALKFSFFPLINLPSLQIPICIHDCRWSHGLCSKSYFNRQLDLFRQHRKWGKNGDKRRFRAEGETVKQRDRQTDPGACRKGGPGFDFGRQLMQLQSSSSADMDSET